MNYELTTHKNLLKVLTVPMPNLASVTVTVWVKTGSRYETPKLNGISHFLEHMVFKGTKKRPTAKEIAENIDSIGGEFNAATSKDWTNFYIKARAGNLERVFDVLSDVVLNPILAKEEIEREKGVIVEELRMYEDTPMIKIGDVFEELIFAGNSLGRDIGGSEKTVRGIERDDFVRYRKMHYYPQNMLITVAGGVKVNEVEIMAEKYFQKLQTSKTPKLQAFDEFKTEQKKPQIKLHPKKKEQAHFILGFLGEGRGYSGRYAQAILTTILGGGMSSRLFSEVRERRGLAYAIKTGPERYQETGYIGTQAGVDVKRVDEAIAVTLSEHYKLADGSSPISKKELEKAKEYLKGNIALALEDTKDVCGFFADQALFLDKVLTPEKVFKKIDGVRAEEVVIEAKKLFRPERLNLGIIGPYESSSRFEKLLQ